MDRTIHNNARSLSIISFSLFSAWMLSFPFEGQILHALIVEFDLNHDFYVFSGIFAHLVGLLLCGFLIKSLNAAKNWMLGSFVFFFGVSILFFFSSSFLWWVGIVISSFIAGVFVGAFGFFYKTYTPKKDRMKTAADVLIYSNILMILVNLASNFFSFKVGLSLAMIMLLFGLVFTFFLPTRPEEPKLSPPLNHDNPIKITKPLLFLCVFIVVITINSGLMYQIVVPAYTKFNWLTSWYWAIPYIIALIVMRNLPQNTKRTYILYIAIAMIGFAYMIFMGTDPSVPIYLLVNTLMLGAFGIYDLFWWSILGELLEFHDHPAQIFGIGLSANMLGVLLGILIGKYTGPNEIIKIDPLMLAIAIVIISFLILPPLHKSLSSLMEDHAFLKSFYEKPVASLEGTPKEVVKFEGLSARESQVASLLLERKTYKMIAEELFISENTVKYYVKNIYSKYHVQSRGELIKYIVENKD